MSKIYDVLYSKFIATKTDEEKKRILERILYYLIVESDESEISATTDAEMPVYYPGQEFFMRKYAPSLNTADYITFRQAERPERAPDPRECPEIISSYWKKYDNLLNAAGNLRQTQGAKTGLKHGNPDVIRLAKKEDKDIDRYQRQILEQIKVVISAFQSFNRFAYDNYLPYIGRNNPEQALWLMAALVVNKDYREFCRRTMNSTKKKGELLSIAEIEERYRKLLIKRAK